MTDELLGELAARMKLIADAMPQHKLSALQALGLARECVRQMEWARRERTKEAKRMITQRRAPQGQWVSTEDVLHTMDLLEEPLTLAPESYFP